MTFNDLRCILPSNLVSLSISIWQFDNIYQLKELSGFCSLSIAEFEGCVDTEKLIYMLKHELPQQFKSEMLYLGP